MGGRNGCAAGSGDTGVLEPADRSPPGGMNATNIHGTVIAAGDGARHRHVVWQQSPWPVDAIGAGKTCDPADAIIAPWQCAAPFAGCACDCGACAGFAAVTGGAPNASAVHASHAKASVRRNHVELGRGKRTMHASIDAAKWPLNPGVGFMPIAADAYTAAMPGTEP